MSLRELLQARKYFEVQQFADCISECRAGLAAAPAALDEASTGPSMSLLLTLQLGDALRMSSGLLPEALSAFSAARQLAAAQHLSDYELSARLGTARCLRAQGKTEEAAEEFAGLLRAAAAASSSSSSSSFSVLAATVCVDAEVELARQAMAREDSTEARRLLEGARRRLDAAREQQQHQRKRQRQPQATTVTTTRAEDDGKRPGKAAEEEEEEGLLELAAAGIELAELLLPDAEMLPFEPPAHPPSALAEYYTSFASSSSSSSPSSPAALTGPETSSVAANGAPSASGVIAEEEEEDETKAEEAAAAERVIPVIARGGRVGLRAPASSSYSSSSSSPLLLSMEALQLSTPSSQPSAGDVSDAGAANQGAP